MGAVELAAIKARMREAAIRSGREPDDVRLLAVSKGHSNRAVRELYAAGQRAFGENRPQGLHERFEADLPSDIEWDYVGNVQRRAIKVIAPRIVLLHSLDRSSLILSWARIEQPPPVLIEVNIAGEPQKHGFSPAALGAAADAVVDAGIELRGLMTIPPARAASGRCPTVVRSVARSRRSPASGVTRPPSSCRWE